MARHKETEREVAKEILGEVRAAFEKFGGAVGMKLKIEELEKRYCEGKSNEG